MNEGLIPRRYAKALYKVALERGQDTAMFTLMSTLAQSFGQNPSLGEAVANPFIDIAEKDRLLTVAAGATGADSTFADFLKLLARNKRIPLIGSIALAYIDIYRKARNIRRVEVVSAAPLDPAVEARIKDIVAKHLNGATMDFSSHVDPDLIGGFIVNIDNERLDASLRNQLKELRLSLLN